MKYTEKFQNLANIAQTQVEKVEANTVNQLIASGAIALDIRDPDEHAMNRPVFARDSIT